MEDLTVTAQQADPTSSETSSLGAGTAAPEVSPAPEASPVPSEPMAASVQVAVPVSSEAASAAGESRAGDAAELDQAEADAAKLEASRADALRVANKVINLSSGNRAWEADGADRKPQFGSGPTRSGKRPLTALAAVAAVAALVGAFGSMLATSGLKEVAGRDVASDRNHALEVSVAQIDADILALKASLENTSRQSLAQLSKTGESLAKLEKAQADPTSKIGRMAEALELLRDAPPAIAPAPVAAARIVSKDFTGSIAPPPAAAPKVAVARLPTVDGWMLRKITRGVALIEGRDGLYYEVHAGDPVPGLGRVDAIRRQDGRWVVVTSSGLVVGH
jgi:hypothetical protein